MARGRVKKVIDGDTFKLASGERVRIAGLHAPELKQHGGKAAKGRLQQTLKRSKYVGLSRVLATSYGRSVRRVTVKSKDVGKLVSRPSKRQK